jgi:hypothetical protein
LYASKHAVSAIAERLQEFRGQTIVNNDLYQGELPLSLVSFELTENVPLLDLVQASELSTWGIDPLQVATKDRAISQRLARMLYEKGIPGFLWWSSLEPSWTNASLFESRAASNILVERPIKPLTTTMPELIEAAKKIGVQLKQGR